jgi:hypothetical protein
MKLLLLFLLPALSNNHSIVKKDTKETYYYFCVSRALKSTGTNEKQYVLLTELKKVNCDETYLDTKAHDWSNFVNDICKNESGCTSDLNSYRTFREAKLQYQKTQRNFSDKNKYQFKKVSF